MKFKNFDTVKWAKKPGVWTVVTERVDLYLVQFGGDAATRDWAKPEELELINRPEPESPAGIYPSEPLVK